MRKIIVNHNVPEMDHHEFIYKEGKKIPKPDDGVVYAYIDEHGLLHATEWMDDASQYGNGVFMETDEIGNDHGVPTVNGKAYRIWGAGSNYVKISSETREKFYTKVREGAKKIVTHPNSEDKAEAYEILRQIYNAIEDAIDEEAEKTEEENEAE